jgi:hypothetical protein
VVKGAAGAAVVEGRAASKAVVEGSPACEAVVKRSAAKAVVEGRPTGKAVVDGSPTGEALVEGSAASARGRRPGTARQGRRQPRVETPSASGPAVGSTRQSWTEAAGWRPPRRRQWRRIAAMIAHVVLFRPRPELTDVQRQAVIDAMKAAASGIPSIRRLRVGRRVRLGRQGYEQLMREDFEFVVIIEFDDAEGLTAYLDHPKHAAIGAHFMQSSAAALAYDYEMIELN